ncbi:hypothetical protein EDB92DRAFT_1820639 [Lactarius akahatsu]|uniref:FAR1 domain-containing protein n=1 Tax=Lactarius akahatsu TaxID=416441 RepID=A0AAD4L7L0_9AGAM|nr:hypothetical protein EDB92DRAFT_1820639 [Lactarius akahatsu]
MPATFEIPVGPPITENLCTFQTPGSNRQLTEDPAMSHWYGSTTHDWKRGKMTLEWANEEDFLAWLAAEESDQTIELICLREWTGGHSKSGATASEGQERKIPSKKTGCRCQLTIKLYRHTETILGKYENDHDHPLGDNNLRFTQLSDKTRDLVMQLVHIGVDTKAIMSSAPPILILPVS